METWWGMHAVVETSLYNTHANIREHLNNRHVLVAACYSNILIYKYDLQLYLEILWFICYTGLLAKLTRCG